MLPSRSSRFGAHRGFPMTFRTPIFVTALVLAASCQSAYYSTMEKFGVHKREILVDRVEDARESQQEAKEQFQTTFEAFKALTSFDGGKLESVYNRLNSEYEDSVETAESVRSRIESVRDVSQALFKEWDGEIKEITDPALKKKSRALKSDTVKRYDQLMSAMNAASERMDPVLEAFKNNVLFLKHNLNAQAIASLEDTSFKIEQSVAELIARMQASIDEANAFVASMSGGD
jgi:ElaB/YqjD/DUF883 family membrane-anchored ribosome-binding protein